MLELVIAFTYFFRDQQTLELAVKVLVPRVLGKQKIKIWDAGCAMGPEPFTLAILLAENLGNFAFKNLHIDATDIDRSNQFEDIITNGIYPYKQLKRIPKDIFQKYFSQTDDPAEYQIAYKIRNSIDYTKHDLLTLEPPDDKYDLILCKNVLLHLKYSERIQVIEMFHRALGNQGVLTLEQTQKLPREVKSHFSRVKSNAQIFEKR